MDLEQIVFVCRRNSFRPFWSYTRPRSVQIPSRLCTGNIKLCQSININYLLGSRYVNLLRSSVRYCFKYCRCQISSKSTVSTKIRIGSQCYITLYVYKLSKKILNLGRLNDSKLLLFCSFLFAYLNYYFFALMLFVFRLWQSSIKTNFINSEVGVINNN